MIIIVHSKTPLKTTRLFVIFLRVICMSFLAATNHIRLWRPIEMPGFIPGKLFHCINALLHSKLYFQALVLEHILTEQTNIESILHQLYPCVHY